METKFDPLWFSITSMVIVYIGLSVIAFGLYCLAKTLKLSEKFKGFCCCSTSCCDDKKKVSEETKSSTGSSAGTTDRQNMVLAVATALYLEQSSAGDMKLTGERFEAFDSTWKLNGRVQGMRPVTPWQQNLSRRV